MQYEPTLLCRAAFEGNLDALASASQADLSQHSPVMGFTPFHHAAIAGDPGAIDALSKAGADAGSMNHMGITPLMLASVCGNVRAVEAMLKLPAAVSNPNAKEMQYGRTALHFAAIEGLEEATRALLGCEAVEKDVLSLDGSSPLWLACSAGREETVKALVQVGRVDVNRVCKGVTALQCAILRKHVGVVSTLLSAKASPTPMSDGSSLLSVAYGSGADGCVVALVKEGGVDVNERMRGAGASVLLLAARKGKLDIVKALAECPSTNMSDADPDGEMVLHFAVRGRCCDAVAAVAAKKKLPANSKNTAGYTALYMAVAMGLTDLVRALCKIPGIDVQAADNDGWTPLHVASNKDMLEIAKILCAAGAHTKAKNQNATPGDLSKSDEMRQVLKEAQSTAGKKAGKEGSKPAQPKKKR